MKSLLLVIVGCSILEISGAVQDTIIANEWGEAMDRYMVIYLRDTVIQKALNSSENEFVDSDGYSTEELITLLWNLAKNDKMIQMDRQSDGQVELKTNKGLLYFLSKGLSAMGVEDRVARKSLNGFLRSHWKKNIDQDGNGKMNFEEFKFIVTSTARVGARTLIEAFDVNDNQKSDHAELGPLYQFLNANANTMGVNEDQRAFLRAHWSNLTDQDITMFLIRTWKGLAGGGF